MEKWYLKKSWEEEDQKDFYSKLRQCTKEDQADAVFKQALHLTSNAETENQDLLKAAESLVNFWLINYSHYFDDRKANYLLQNIYEKLEEHEKAEHFRNKNKIT